MTSYVHLDCHDVFYDMYLRTRHPFLAVMKMINNHFIQSFSMSDRALVQGNDRAIFEITLNPIQSLAFYSIKRRNSYTKNSISQTNTRLPMVPRGLIVR